MDPRNSMLSACTDCRWFDIQVDADRETFWCMKKREDISDRDAWRKVCEHFEPAPRQPS